MVSIPKLLRKRGVARPGQRFIVKTDERGRLIYEPLEEGDALEKEPKPNHEDPTYNKKVRGPNIAELMNAVPGEIEEIFEMLLEGMGPRVRVAMG